MALENWVDKINGKDYINADDINKIAKAILEIQEELPEIGGEGFEIVQNVDANNLSEDGIFLCLEPNTTNNYPFSSESCFLFVQNLGRIQFCFSTPEDLGAQPSLYSRLKLGGEWRNWVEGVQIPEGSVGEYQLGNNIRLSKFINDISVDTEQIVDGAVTAEKTSFIVQSPIYGKNIFDNTKVSSGQLGNSGGVLDNSSQMVSDFIEVDDSLGYCFSSVSDSKAAQRIAFYDSSKSFIANGYYSISSGEVQATLINGKWVGYITFGVGGTYAMPVGTKYFRVSASTAFMTTRDIQLEIGLSPTAFNPFGVIGYRQELDDSFNGSITKEKLAEGILNYSTIKGKIINALGDSITSDEYTTPTWWQIIAERTGASFNDYGVGGTSIAQREGFEDSFVERAVSLSESADVVIVMGGTNDSVSRDSVPPPQRGAWNSIDPTTLFGALNTLFTTLCNKFAGKPILVCTPIQKADGFTSNVADPRATLLGKQDTDTLSIQLIAEAVKLKAAQYGLPCLDLYTGSGISGADSDYVYYRKNNDETQDYLHPSEAGQNRLANIIQRELEKFFR